LEIKIAKMNIILKMEYLILDDINHTNFVIIKI